MRAEFLAVFLFLLPHAALAQDCGGMPNVNGICIPPDQKSSPLYETYGRVEESSVPVKPRIEWAESWGAISSDGEGNYGIASDSSSKRKAEKSAIADCRKRSDGKSGGECSIQLVYYNQCVAVGASEVASYSSSAPTIGEAAERVIERCELVSGKNQCWIYYSGCSLPRRIR